MLRVVLESPFSGETLKNREYLQRCIRDCLKRGETPYASHQMLTEALNDADPKERSEGIEAGFEWRRVADYTVVYEDYGISDGMYKGLEHARKIGQPIYMRRIGK